MAVVPYLPPELWLRIHDHTTTVSGTLDPDIHFHTELNGLYDDPGKYADSDINASLRQAQTTRRWLPLVCKHWYEMFIHRLYQSVIFEGDDALSSLTCALSTPPRIPGAPPLGHYTERMDILSDFTNNSLLVSKGTEYMLERGLATLFGSCPRLSILVITFRAPEARISPSMMGALCQNVPNLKVLQLRNISLRSTDTEALLRSIPDLRILACYHIAFPQNHIDSANIPYLPLHTVAFSKLSRPEFIQSGSLPQLRSLVLHGNAFFTDTRNETFLRAVGATLRTIHWDVEDREKIQLWVSQIGRHCPNLERLVLSVPEYAFFDPEAFPLPLELELPPVTCLGLRTAAPGPARSRFTQDARYEHIWSFLTKIHGLAPSVSTVQFLNIGARHKEELEDVPSGLSHIKFEHYYRLAQS
ncbi:hypothetical protein CONPUDRAFT_150355 [Coniophora puteana RWD-64-598 SS2]|uniref:F-box domain-containing protein n=1 Tax=Coniophora puteana (strain RWD-64-598) TaxID=741705 RepID=A0A5M3N3S5_CONPW|nr:uncharacterized protein CONPUDRAFT_150355 [Coniophora puteana RWD-64-598 SS2]EIW85551.1 hypothetical protein CONPUDRAFT_150355 [Coniophora puteana RWD-64-598 SS2]